MGKRVILIKSSSLGGVDLVLKSAGYQVIHAENKDEAVDVLRNSEIEADLIVTGIQLYEPGADSYWINAYELAEYYQHRKLPVVVHSTRTKPRRSDWPNDLSITIVEDPWDPESLLTAVEIALTQQT